MLRTAEQRERREGEMRLRQEALARIAALKLYSVGEAAAVLRVSRGTIIRLIQHEPDVLVIHTPGSRRRIFRIPQDVIDRLLERMMNP